MANGICLVHIIGGKKLEVSSMGEMSKAGRLQESLRVLSKTVVLLHRDSEGLGGRLRIEDTLGPD